MSDQSGPSSSAAVEEPLKTEEECNKLLSHGEVMIIRHRYQEAVDALEECVRNMARIHGEGHDTIGDAYLYYGRALLGMEQMDESLFQKNGAMEAEAEESGEDEEEGDDADEEDQEGGEEDEEGAAVENGREEDEGREEEKADGEEAAASDKEQGGDQNGQPSALDNVDLDGENTDSPAPVVAAAAEENSTAAGAAAPTGEAEQDDQITNMQVAWEVTELARKIFLARGSDNLDDVKKLGRAYATLAEIAMLSGQYAESAADFGRAYDILLKTDDDTLREQAEVLYLRSNALVSCNRFDDAKDVLRLVLDKLSAHQENLRQKTDQDSTKEIEEVESLKQQLSGKFDEIEIAREDIAKFREQKDKVGLNGEGSSRSPVKQAPGPAGASGSGEKPVVHDISHLVRRRKKPDGDGDGPATSEESSQPKKAKVDVPATEQPPAQVEVNGSGKKEDD